MGHLTEQELLRRKYITQHCRERDRELWLLDGLNKSVNEYFRRLTIVSDVRIEELKMVLAKEPVDPDVDPMGCR